MSNSDKLKEGRQKRREYLRSPVTGSKVNARPEATLDPPLLKDIIPGLPEGLIAVAALRADLDLKIPYWGSVVALGRYADVTVRMKNANGVTHHFYTKRTNGPLSSADFPLEQNFPLDKIPHEGTFSLEYHVIVSGGLDNDSIPQVITIDRTAPYANPNPDLAFPAPLTVPATVITDATFSGGVTEFVCTLPEYPDIADSDMIVVYWEQGLPPDSPNAPDPVFGPAPVPANRKIPISKADIERHPNGATFAVYWLTDKAGNVSSISLPAQVDVQLGALPTDLKDPEVPLGPIVDLADAHLGVKVRVPAFTNTKDAAVEAKWGAKALDPVIPGSMPRDVFVPVPWGTLKGEYTGGPGEETVQVSYLVRRGSLTFPLAPLTVDVQVDFSTIGPGNPNEPDPVNPTLDKIHLTGADGQDKLTPNDAGKDIVATVALYDPVLPGEVLKLYWGNKEEAVDEFSVVTESAGTPIDFTIPWVDIEAQANNAALPMYYTINSATGNNPQRSEDTLVEVSVLVVGFEPVIFPDIHVDDLGNRTLSCASLYSEDYTDPTAKFGFRVTVPGDKDFKPGDRVSVEWLGYEFDGTTAIPGTRFTHNHPALTDDEVLNGFTFLVEPYATHILPISEGYANVTYIVTPVGGGAPIPANPMPQKELVLLIRPGPEYCVVPPPPPKP
ncbi:hypothetical protein YA0002_06860 [Pseudomonas cichorii]|uniref:hypothetical protein n=1 Tax=Pseudomonas cichorii TaxID=36746 RepID=UPI0018E5D678|nr:hypothetical protein [Pseudomonas cichorii]MBI6852481.1 hypothetical protein [Pseudomonas cichorii]